MIENPLTGLWTRGGVAYSGWLSIPGSWSAEVMARAGYDALVIDLQHGLLDTSGLLPMLQAIQGAGVPALVRAAWNEPSGLMRPLDAGAYGVICPMVGTRQECEAFVTACRYPPAGFRSFGPTRSLQTIGPDYVRRSEAFALTFAQIETAQGLANVETIAAVPGLTGLYVGPWDLSLDLGLAVPGDLADPELSSALDTVLEACRRHRLVAGIYTGSPEEGRAMASRGFQLVNIATDTALLRAGALQGLRQARA